MEKFETASCAAFSQWVKMINIGQKVKELKALILLLIPDFDNKITFVISQNTPTNSKYFVVKGKEFMIIK